MASMPSEYPFPPVYRQNSLLTTDDLDMDEHGSISSSVEYLMQQGRPRRMYSTTKIVIACFVTGLLPLLFMISRPGKSDNVPMSRNAIDEAYFDRFGGHQECGVSLGNLYIPLSFNDKRTPKHKVFCANRKSLLEALSGGGRTGFDNAYSPVGCHYRWYTIPEICMILERFDGIVFIGDDMLKHIYAAFNMLLRENVALGGLKQWELGEEEKESCRCDAQVTRAKCGESLLVNSEDVTGYTGEKGQNTIPYRCRRTPHFYLPISGSPASEELHNRFNALLKGDPDSYKPIPVIHTLGLSTSLSWPSATGSMDEWLGLADASGRNTPFLWLGPNAAGHLKPPTQILSQGNNALWHYTIEMAKEAHSRDLDVLGMYNLTLQASSWDGSGYGIKVGLVQAMMVINWLARVDST